jgi:hypothetical protein
MGDHWSASALLPGLAAGQMSGVGVWSSATMNAGKPVIILPATAGSTETAGSLGFPAEGLAVSRLLSDNENTANQQPAVFSVAS